MKTDPNGDIHLRQSDIETFMQCPEQLRLKWLIETEPGTFETDAATCGTVIHAMIEADITSDGHASLRDAKVFAAKTFLQLLEQYREQGSTYSTQTFGTHERLLAALDPLVEAWWNSAERDMLMHMEASDMLVEWHFDRPFIERPGRGTIYLTGTSDLVIPEHNQVWDWKTASGPYQKWEKQRWAVQPATYLWATQDAGIVKPDDMGRYRFDYKVFVRAAKVKPPVTYTIYRTQESFDWLANVVDRMVNMIERLGMDDPWPLNDHSALCGPRWCPFWDSCKGSHINGDDWY